MPEINISATTRDSASFIAHNYGVRVESFWDPKAEDVHLRLELLSYENVAATAVWDGFMLSWTTNPPKQRNPGVSS